MSSRRVQGTSNTLFSDASDSADTTQPATVDAAEATAESDCEDTADPDNTIDADLLESLAQDFNCCATVATDHGPPASSGQPQSVRSPSPDPGPPPSVQSEHGNSDGQPQLIVDTFPHGSPGAPIPDVRQGSNVYQSSHELFGSSIWAPFRSQCDWEVAHWAKTRGPTSSALADLLAIPSVADNLGLSYRTPKELNDIIDKELPGCPPFKCQDLTIAGDTHQVYFRDTLQCIRSLYGNPEFARDLAFAPERHYVDHRRACRVYSEMHTGDWWWAVQTSLEAHRPGATVVPVIISSDKTQLTLFRGKTAYPVYLTIGNIPKDTRRKPSRRAQILVGYLPTTRLEMINNKAARRRALGNVFHLCMRNILAPIASYGETGIPMMSGDGVWRRCHPIFAVFIGDYPEQGLVTCTYFGQCPKCTVHRNNLGDYSTSPPRDYDEALESFRLADGDVLPFHAACREARLKPTFHPFWEALPLTDIFVSITPDILHQMLQGVMKHLIAWLTSAFGAVKIDVRCRSLPPNHHITTFVRGISTLSRVSGLEHKQMCKILLGLVLDLPLPSGEAPSRIIKTVRALLDFLYLAQLPSHTTDTLLRLEQSLSRFHDNKEVFIDLGVREHLNIPKVHSMMHYKSSIILFGTTDNYNTEQTERLHIDLAKDAYRATNHKDEYPQMTAWLERREKIQQHGTFVTWRQQAQQETVQDSKPNGPPKPVPRTIQMTRHPSRKAVSFDILADKYRALDFQDALADFIARINHPQASATALRALAEDTLLPFRSVPVYHKIKFVSSRGSEIVDAVHVRPEQRDARGRVIPSRFDTVIVHGNAQVGALRNKGPRIAQVRVVFQLPSKVIHQVFLSPDIALPTHLAYVEWFSPIPTTPDSNDLYKVSRLTQNGRHLASVIPVDSLFSSVHLLPRFGPETSEWNTFSVLELCRSFYVNPFSNRDVFLLHL
ncbi:hypothetical protein EDB92DRAFT_1810600 [Lactarius akahatsu]|uniref:DUF6830 domain-containing protein n=1 Tax=Lactarius akahatsu TaxID=416441 RepID=A0AAD4L402_9AGAM|nr:hypothetical protein EDB92DRAFT_1810600 [Lactarius akahatsu]